MLITDEYKKLNEELHTTNKHYGTTGVKWADAVIDLTELLKSQDVLDYGCGKSTLANNLPFDIKQYDPAIPKYAARPEPADILVCTDVLEHIEPECLDDVLNDLYMLTKRACFISIHIGPAKKTLPDGRNAHLIQENDIWWFGAILPRFYLFRYHASGIPLEGEKNVLEYIYYCTPRPGFIKEKSDDEKGK